MKVNEHSFCSKLSGIYNVTVHKGKSPHDDVPPSEYYSAFGISSRVFAAHLAEKHKIPTAMSFV